MVHHTGAVPTTSGNRTTCKGETDSWGFGEGDCPPAVVGNAVQLDNTTMEEATMKHSVLG